MKHLDKQLARFNDRPRQEVRLSNDEANKVATLVAAEIRFLPVTEAKQKIQENSYVLISKRYEELRAFQSWSESTRGANDPAAIRALVIVQVYVCLVYLSDACFQIVKHARDFNEDSVLVRCSKYLSTGKRRKFRNAFVHANWQYKPDFSGLECWAEEDGRPERFIVSQRDLDFWSALSRGVAYAVYE